MKLIVTTFVLAATVFFHLGSALPAAEPEPQPSALASYSVPEGFSFVQRDGDSGGLNATLDKRENKGAFIACTAAGCSNCGSIVTFSYSNRVCVDTRGRHYYLLSGCNARVTLYSGTNCGSGDSGLGGAETGICHNVNTGSNWQSASVQCY